MKNSFIYSIILSILLINISSANNSDSSDLNTDYNIIHLIGEDHHDSECIDIKNTLSQKAENNQIILALEGIPFDQENGNNVFGIEEKNIQAISQAWDFCYQFLIYKITKDLNPSTLAPVINSSKDQFDMFFSSPSQKLDQMFHILNALDRDLQTIYAKYPKIIEAFINLHNLKSTPAAHKKKILQLTKDHSFEKPFFLKMNSNLPLWINLFKDVTTLFIESALRNNEQISLDTISELNFHTKKIHKYAGMDAEEINKSYISLITHIGEFAEFINKNITVDCRNQIFLKNIINIFENNKSQEKPFYAIVGANHIPFLSEELEKKGYQLHLNNWEQYNSKSSVPSSKSEL